MDLDCLSDAELSELIEDLETVMTALQLCKLHPVLAGASIPDLDGIAGSSGSRSESRR